MRYETQWSGREIYPEDVEAWLAPADPAFADESVESGEEAEDALRWLANIGTGAATGAATGAVAGPWGALAGAVLGGALGAAQTAAQQSQQPAPAPSPRRTPAPPPRPAPAPRRAPRPAAASSPRPAPQSRPAAPPQRGSAPAISPELLQQLAQLLPQVVQLLASSSRPAGAGAEAEETEPPAVSGDQVPEIDYPPEPESLNGASPGEEYEESTPEGWIAEAAEVDRGWTWSR